MLDAFIKTTTLFSNFKIKPADSDKLETEY
jgi:hypothetical protein